VKSTQVIENGGTSCTLTFGSGGDSGAAYGLPACLLQIVHQRSNFLTYWQPDGIQNDCLTAVRVEPIPAWKIRACTWLTISAVSEAAGKETWPAH